jgi:DNA-binding NtrC family response regulator
MQGADDPHTAIITSTDELPGRRLRAFRLRSRAAVHQVAKPSIRVGSLDGCDIVLADDAVSRLHFAIEADEIGYRVRDLGSKNGTFVDNYRVREIYLRPGSMIRAGSTELLFEAASDEVDVPASQADHFGPLVGRSVEMRELYATLERAAQSGSTILVEGESGTGKELVARAVHAASRRAEGPFVTVDCAAIPAMLLESQLFGHERGAFTGAVQRRIGYLEEASGGTLFLDEIGELTLDLQPKLLRALECGEIRRVGGQERQRVDVRVVAASNRDLAAEVNKRTFRDDLYYRLAVVTVRVPPLRDRLEDLPLLVEHLVRRALGDDRKLADRILATIDRDTWARLAAYPWPGNVRELRNTIERGLALRRNDAAPVFDPVHATPAAPDESLAESGEAWTIDLSRPHPELKAEWIRRFDRAYVMGQLALHDGNISRAARASGLERTHFKRILNRYR